MLYQKKINQLSDNLESLLEEIRPLTDEVINKKPSADAWSVSEVMQHLMTSERLSLLYLKKKTSYESNFRKAGIRTHLRLMGLKLFLWAPLKFKAPAVVDRPVFKSGLTVAELSRQWRENRKALFYFLENSPQEWQNREIYKHPLAGRLTISGMLEFFHSHFCRHRRQIHRTVKKCKQVSG